MIKKSSIFFIFLCLFFINACSKQIPPPKLAMEATIAVAPFNQPSHATQLLAGYIPDEQGQLYSDYAANYDRMFKEKLSKTNRNYIFLSLADLDVSIVKDSKGRNNSLTSWAKLAQKMNADFILVPQVIDIEERIGDDMYVRSPARLICDFYLIKAYNPELPADDKAGADGYLQKRFHYKQVIMPTIENDYGDRLNTRDRSAVTFFMNDAINGAIHNFAL